MAAYNLLVELAKDCPENTEVLTNELIQMHHTSRAKSAGKSVNFFSLPPLKGKLRMYFVNSLTHSLFSGGDFFLN